MDRAGNLVHILPARTLCAHSSQLDLVIGNDDIAGDVQHGAYAAATVMRTSPTATTDPARILAVLRDSTCPSTDTTPSATSALPAPPLSHTPASLSSWLSSTNSPRRWNSSCCIT